MANSDVKGWNYALEGFTKESFEADGKRRDICSWMGSGPAVIVMSEMPGITPGVAQFGRRVAAAGCTAVMPDMFGTPGKPVSVGYVLGSIGPACISKEFSCLALKKTSPITVWLRKLAAAEHERCGGPGVGAVGMCFTGGFALAMMVDDITCWRPCSVSRRCPSVSARRRKAWTWGFGTPTWPGSRFAPPPARACSG